LTSRCGPRSGPKRPLPGSIFPLRSRSHEVQSRAVHVRGDDRPRRPEVLQRGLREAGVERPRRQLHLRPSVLREEDEEGGHALKKPGSKWSRRDFSQQLTLAALGGLAAGSIRQDSSKPALKINVDPALLLDADPHVCRGLNSCKGKGKGGGNA